MRATKAWARTWPGAGGEPLLRNTREIRELPRGSTARCDARGCMRAATHGHRVMRGDRTTFERFICPTCPAEVHA